MGEEAYGIVSPAVTYLGTMKADNCMRMLEMESARSTWMSL